jgi:phage shock protein A
MTAGAVPASGKGAFAPMASLSKRLAFVFRAKANKALDRAEDPRETLDYSYQKQMEMLQKVRRGVADVATSRKRLELQMTGLQQSAEKLQGQAQQALTQNREDLAREALTRRSGIQTQLGDLSAQHAQLQAEEEKLTAAAQRLAAKVESFRTRKETIKASYTAAEAQTRIGEAFSGISEEMSDVGLAMQRAEDKTAQMQARAGAMDELLASGALDDPTSTGRGDDIQVELDRMSSTSDVELELARMKGALGAGSAPAALEGGATAADTAEPIRLDKEGQ